MVPGAGRYEDGSGTDSTVVPSPDMIIRPEVRRRRHGVGPPAGDPRPPDGRRRAQADTTLSPSTLTLVSGSAWRAGPFCGEPLLMENSLPWHGQTITPASILLTSQPWWVQTLLNARNSPLAG